MCEKTDVLSYLSMVLGGSLLVTGTCIGAAALSLPIGMMGLGGAMVWMALLGVAIMMGMAGTLVYEANTYFQPGTNLTTMTRSVFGVKASYAVVLIFLILMYALLSAYMTGGAVLTRMICADRCHVLTKPQMVQSLWMVLGILMLLVRFRWLDNINRIFVAMLVLSYTGFMIDALPHFNLARAMSIPSEGGHHVLILAVTAFGFQVIVPSLRQHLKGAHNVVIPSMVGGVLLTCFLYGIWCYAVYGTIPYQGPHGLLSIAGQKNATMLLSNAWRFHHVHAHIALMMDGFLWSAVVTSFIGIALSLRDFLTDLSKTMFQIESIWLSSVMTMVPPFLFSVFVPNGFEIALHYAGLSVACVNIALPCLLVWKLRGTRSSNEVFQMLGGRAVLLAVGSFACWVFITGLF